MVTKTVPNIFMSLYRLARHDSYDITKWRSILTGIHRKSKEKHNIKDICLLYYSLFKGCTNKDISNMEITYRDKITRKDLGPFSIRDIGDAYIDIVSDLMKYMNTKQLAMISKFLLMMNKLNEPLCNIILSKINSNNLKITSRSFFNIILSLSESNYVNSETIENLLIQNKDFLYNMNKIDFMYLLKSISINNIKNEFILNIVSDKLEYYSQDMKPEELLSTLYSFYTLNWYNETNLRTLFFRIQNILDKFNISSLVLITKYLSHFNLKDIKDFFNLQLIPFVHEKVENNLDKIILIDSFYITDNNNTNSNKTKSNKKKNKEKEKTDKDKIVEKEHKGYNTDELLLFYSYCLRSGSSCFPKLLVGLLEELGKDYQWNILFSIFYKYQINLNYNSSYINNIINYFGNNEIGGYYKDKNSMNYYLSKFDKNTHSNVSNELVDYLNLVLKAINLFKCFINKTSCSDFNTKYMVSISKYITECGIDKEELVLEILKKIEKSEGSYSFDYLVDVMFNFHTVDFGNPFCSSIYDGLMKRVVEDKRSLNANYIIPIMCILFYRNIEIPQDFIHVFKSIFVNNEIQDTLWQVSNPESTKIFNKTLDTDNNKDNNNTNENNKDNENNTRNISNENKNSNNNKSNENKDNINKIDINLYKRYMMNNISDEVLEYLLYTIVIPNINDLNLNQHKFMDFKTEICLIFKMIKKFTKETLLNVLLYYIGEIDKSLFKSLIEIKDINYTELSIDVVNIDNIPDVLSHKFEQMDCVLIKIGDEIIFNPCYLVPGTKEIYYFDSSREKWESVSRNILRAILHINNFSTHKI